MSAVKLRVHVAGDFLRGVGSDEESAHDQLCEPPFLDGRESRNFSILSWPYLIAISRRQIPCGVLPLVTVQFLDVRMSISIDADESL